MLSIFNLNIMHGRNCRNAIWPLRMNHQKIKDNLSKITDLISRYSPDIVTLQEVDESSIMSGGLNQFNFLDTKLNYPFSYFAPSCSAVLFHKNIFISGNAIFSKYPLFNCESHYFFFTFPTDRQGFVIADVKLPTGDILSIVSVHTAWLDWLRFNSRSHQLKLLQRIVADRKRKTIIAGDMNCDLRWKEKSLRSFIKNLDLSTFDSENNNLNTSPSWNPTERIDWILPSKEINFISHQTIGDVVSDHLAIFANLAI